MIVIHIVHHFPFEVVSDFGIGPEVLSEIHPDGHIAHHTKTTDTIAVQEVDITATQARGNIKRFALRLPPTGSLIGVGIWVIVNIFAVNRDAHGVPFKPAKTLKIVLGIIMSILMFFAATIILLTLMTVAMGILAGYTTATARYNANTVLEQAALLSIQAQISQENQEIPFKDQEQGGVDKMAAFPDGIVQMQITDAALATQIRKIAGDKVVSGCRGTGSCIIRFGE